jgi:CubicO group peptidase (beta-lactamase class C family)
LQKAALLLLVTSTSILLHAQTGAVGSVEGLWGAETRLGVPIAGDLTVDGRNGKWSASIGGYEVPASLADDRLTFTLPAQLGSFRGNFDSLSHNLQGEWIQPGGVILDPQYATPIALHLISANVWRGEVVPLEQRLSAYLLISSNNGTLTAVASNPEGNFFRRRVYTVTQDQTSISLEANGKKFKGVYNQQAGTLSVQLVGWLPPFSFTRKTPNDALGFYPRLPSAREQWVYSQPIDSKDGWSVSTLKHEDMDEAPIANLMEKIIRADPTSSAMRIQSLLIARHGRLVLEEYFYGFSRDRVHDMRSAGKTFAPVLVGLARQQGAQLRPESLVYPLFSTDAPFANPDDRKKSMTLRDIMTMTAGNACDDNDDASPGNEDRMQSDGQQPDWYKYTLDLPMKTQPGGAQAVYCSGDLNLVGGAVAAYTKTWLPDFFEAHLARPLQFGRYYLNLMPNGEAYMGGGAYLTPRDQLKLGQLYLAGGVWNGQRLLSKEWVTDSTSIHSHFAKDRSLGQEHGYGYGWHLHELHSDGKTYKTFAAEGNGGQFVIAIPALDLVVGITGGAYGEFDQWYRWELELFPEFIIPAVENSPKRLSVPN